MVSKYNDKEIMALDRKEQIPSDDIICPRCGEKLQFREVGTSYEIKCPTKDCLKRTVRGI